MKTFISWLISQIETMIALIVLMAIIFAPSGSEGAEHIANSLRSIFEGDWVAIAGCGTAAIISIVVAFITMIFTWNNFEEVISRSMIWRSSNVDRFGMRLQYSLTIFIETLLLCAMIFIIFISVISK